MRTVDKLEEELKKKEEKDIGMNRIGEFKD